MLAGTFTVTIGPRQTGRNTETVFYEIGRDSYFLYERQYGTRSSFAEDLKRLKEQIVATRYWAEGESRRLAIAPAPLPTAPWVNLRPRRVQRAYRRALRAFTRHTWPRLRRRRKRPRVRNARFGGGKR